MTTQPIYQFLAANKPIAFVLLLVITALICILAVKIMQTIGMEKVRKFVYQKFVEAENRFQQGENTEKFEYVVNLTKQAIPAPFNFFITERFMRNVIQLWFNLVKDLLDNGRVDLSSVRSDEYNEYDENQQ